MIEKITEEELLLMQCLDYPVSCTEVLFSDLENLTHDPIDQLGYLRLYQYPLLSSEYLLDYNPELSKKDNFKLREGAGNLDCFGGRKFGKCEYEENYCTLADGSRVKFKHLVNTERYVLSLNQETLKLEKKLAKFRVNGLRTCLTVKTKKGKEITVTENHPLLTDRGWVLAKDLNSDDYIATPKQTSFGDLIVESEKAILLGYLIGDGSCNSTNIEFTNINEELISEFKDVCSFYDCDVAKHGNYGYRVRGKKRFFNILGKPVANKVQQIVRDYKIDCLAKEKLIPDEVFLWKKEYLALFINRYFSCDGTINKSNNTISLTSASKEMIYQMHSLLLKFDISSSIYYKKIKLNDKFFNSWNLNILDAESCQKFIVEIGIKSKEYKFKFDLKANRSDSIPSSLLLKYYDDFKFKKQLKLRKLKTNNFSRDKLKEINLLEKNSNIQKYIESEILWDKVKSIETVKEKLETVVVSVEDNENYISNDIISHNSHCVETIDILVSIFHLEHTEVGFTSTDAIHIRAILEEKLFPVLNRHPFFDLFEPKFNRSPNYRCAMKNGYVLIGINMNLGSKTPGQQFYGKHLKRLYVEEASFESEEVFNKRIEAGSEMGCVTRSAGMTNFTKYMPAGRRFYDLKNKPWICNLPQYVNPQWDSNEKEKAIKKHGGENSVTYRIFVKGEIVEEGVSVFDMERVRKYYLEDKIIKKYEITKENFGNFKNFVVLDKPLSCTEVLICADIGESAPTEIIIIFKIGDKYKYAYNITVYNLTDKQQPVIFDFIVQKLGMTMIGIDTTDGTGRSIFRTLAERYSDQNMCWCAFNEKLPVGYDRDENGQLKRDEKGNLIIKEEYVSEWSVKRLKDLLYEGELLLPMDYTLDKQLNSVICTQSGNRTVYEVVGDEDHLFSAFRVFSIAEWHKQFRNLTPVMTKKFAKSGV